MFKSLFKSNTIEVKSHRFYSCHTIIRLSRFKTIFFIALILPTFATTAYAQQKCQSLFSQSSELTKLGQRTEITDLNSFGQAMTEGMLLNPGKSDLFEIYLRIFFGDPSIGVDGKTLKSVTDILRSHPELTKQLFPEFTINAVERVYKTPQSLVQFIKSQIDTAGQVRSNLFHIESNLDYWKKILDYNDDAIPNHLKALNLGKDSSNEEREKARAINKARTEFQSKAKMRFMKYLNRIISKTNRQLLAHLKNENTAYYEKAKAFFETLKYLEAWMNKNGRNVQSIRQAMIDLVFTIGYGNQATMELLKSTNGMDRVQGLNQLWAEADSLAEELKFPGHFSELQKKYGIEFPTGLNKNDDFSKLIQSFEKQVLASNYTTRPTQTIRVRSLSIQESPFRSCLGADCSTRTYFDKALDPNYIYFTMTDQSHHSSGHATLVLGTATSKQTGKAENVAFLDKLQNIPTQKIELFLNAVSQSLALKGYKLSIPTNLGKDIPGHGGLSNMAVITDFVQSNILPRLNQVYATFTPHQHQYQFKNRYSRGDQKLEVRVFEPKALEQNTEIRRGNDVESYQAESSLDKNQLAQQVLKLKDSDKSEDILKFIHSIAGVVRLGLYSKDSGMKDLESIAKDESKNLKIRKQAMYTHFDLTNSPSILVGYLERLLDNELNQMIHEILTFKNSNDPRLKKLSDQFVIFNPSLGVKILKSLINNGIDVNAKDNNNQTALMFAADKGYLELVEMLLKMPGINVDSKDSEGRSALSRAIENNKVEIVERLLSVRFIDKNIKIGGVSALFWSIQKGHTRVAELLLKISHIDVNANFHGATYLTAAAARGQTNIVNLLLKMPGINVNFKANRSSDSALFLAAQNGHLEVVELLLKVPGIEINVQEPPFGCPLSIAFQMNNDKIIERLLSVPGIKVSKRHELMLPWAMACEAGQAMTTVVTSGYVLNSIGKPLQFSVAHVALLWCANKSPAL